MKKINWSSKLKSKLNIEELRFDGCKVHPVLQPYLGYCLQKAAQRMRGRLNEMLRSEYDLIVPQYGILIVLDSLGPTSQVDLGDSLGADKATMVKLIDGLEKKKYVTRTASAQDRRIKYVEITPLGIKTRKTIFAIAREIEKEFLSPLTESEAKAFKEILPKLVT